MLLDENLDILLNEAQYFRNPYTEVITKNFEIISEKLRSNDMYNPQGSAESKAIEKALETMFNIEKVDIYWKTGDVPNASTIPCNGVMFTTKKDLELIKDSKGYRFKKKEGKYGIFNIHTALITVVNLTPEECTAILLHEVGHNFFMSNVYKICHNFVYLYYLIFKVIDFLKNLNPMIIVEIMSFIIQMIVVGTKLGRKAISLFKEYDENHLNIIKSSNNISGAITNISSYLSNILLLINGPSILVSVTTSGIVSIPIKMYIMFLSDSYRNEKFADNFATMYGYGVHLSNAMYKVNKFSNQSNANKAFAEIPLIDVYMGTLLSYIDLISGLGDPHPKSSTRIIEQKRYLEEALNTDEVPAKYKNEIRKQIKEIDKIYEDLYDITNYDDNNMDLVKVEFMNLRRELGITDDGIKELIYKTNDYSHSDIFDKYTVTD